MTRLGRHISKRGPQTVRDCTQAVPSRRRNLRRVRHVMPCARRNPSTRCNLRCASNAAQPPRETATARRRRLRRLVSVGQPRQARRGGRSRRCGVSFAGQLPSSDHRAIFVTRDSGRVARQVPRNYPAATHSTLASAWDNRHPETRRSAVGARATVRGPRAGPSPPARRRRSRPSSSDDCAVKSRRRCGRALAPRRRALR